MSGRSRQGGSWQATLPRTSQRKETIMHTLKRCLTLALILITVPMLACSGSSTTTPAESASETKGEPTLQLAWPATPAKVPFPQNPKADALATKSEGATYMWVALPSEAGQTLDANCASFVQSFAKPLQAEAKTQNKEVAGMTHCEFEVARAGFALYGTMTKQGETFHLAYAVLEGKADPASVKKAKDFAYSLRFE